MRQFPSIFSELRKEAGFTQKSLAEALNITDKAISKWERGISLPDIALLPKLSLLLDADIELLLSEKTNSDEWIGFIDLEEDDIDLSQPVYDKPLVYYLLSHFLLLGIRYIIFRTTEKNKEYLSGDIFAKLGFSFSFDWHELPIANVIFLNGPVFLFGSDLTHQFQGAMVTNKITKLAPANMDPPLLFSPMEDAFMYLKNKQYLFSTAITKTLGRGMICSKVNSIDRISDVANFVRFYQNSCSLLIGSIEEIAYKKHLIDEKTISDISDSVAYGDKLRSLLCKPIVG